MDINQTILDRARQDALKLATSIEISEGAKKLAEFVMAQFEIAKSYRMSSGIDERIINAKCAAEGRYNPSMFSRLSDSERVENIYNGVTAPKIKIIAAWAQDILASKMDKPYSLTPTSKPSVPDKMAEKVANDIVQEIEATYGVVDFNNEGQQDFFRAATEQTYDAVQTKAEQAIQRVERVIQDKLMQGGWRATFHSAISDTMIYPASIIKGPYIGTVPRMRWVDGALARQDEEVYLVQRVDPINFYPAPYAKCAQTASYVIEKVVFSAEELKALSKQLGGNEEAAFKVINSNPTGVAITPISTIAMPNSGGMLGNYECIAYHGRVEAMFLSAYGVNTDDRYYTDAEVWVCAGVVIRARLNPHPLNKRPYHTASFRKIDGSIWGQGVADLLSATERLAVRTALSFSSNLKLSSGFFAEANIDKLVNPTALQDSALNEFILVSNAEDYSGRSSAAIKFSTIPSQISTLTSAMDFLTKQADMITGVPAFIGGTSQLYGAGRTAAGFAMMMGNAAKGIKAVITNIDEGQIQHIVGDMYLFVMMAQDTPEADKVDAEVYAYGSSGLIEKELNRGAAVEFLSAITPYLQGGFVKPQAVQYLLREMAINAGHNPDYIAEDPSKKVLTQGDPSAIKTNSSAPPPKKDSITGVALDGRSALPADPGNSENLSRGQNAKPA
jgi:hypothetical protein